MSETTHIPTSEQNPPENRAPGFKPWDETRERWWMGNQWGETYRALTPPRDRPHYIRVYPVVEKYWNVMAVGTLEGDILLLDRFNDANSAIEFADTQAGPDVDVNIELVTDPYEKTSHSEETMIKVYSALIGLKIERKQAFEIVNAIQNEGILFRERAE